jgi:splicing factor 3B subunit 2
LTPDEKVGEPIQREPWGELEPEEGNQTTFHNGHYHSLTLFPCTEEEEESEEEEEEEESEDESAPAPMDGLQTPSGLTSVVSTVAGGLGTLDFIELRKNTSGVRELGESGGQRQLYQVVPERQTNIHGLMGSERGYDISAVAGAANVEVLGQEGRGKVRPVYLFTISISTYEVSVCLFCILAQDWRGGIDRRRRAGRHV